MHGLTTHCVEIDKEDSCTYYSRSTTNLLTRMTALLLDATPNTHFSIIYKSCISISGRSCVCGVVKWSRLYIIGAIDYCQQTEFLSLPLVWRLPASTRSNWPEHTLAAPSEKFPWFDIHDILPMICTCLSESETECSDSYRVVPFFSSGARRLFSDRITS